MDGIEISSLTEEQRNRILLLGDAARDALSSPGVQMALTAVQQDAMRQAFTSEPKEYKLREDKYFLSQATLKVVEMLRGWVAVADNLRVANKEQEADNSEDEE